LKAFFAELSGFPAPYPEISGAPRTAAPLVSCIIIVNHNALFVREQLIPSLFANTRAHPFEVVLVHNGAADSESALAAFGGARCPSGAVSVAYNAGAALARGRYLAFFHDDCMIDDERWVEKCTAALEQGAAAVAAEFRRLERIGGMEVPPLPVAKCVPLFISAGDFASAGRFDEFHYLGYEDLDFTLRLAQLGKRVEAVDLRLRHFDGMSSVLKYCPLPGLAALFAMTAVPRAAILRRFREFAERGLRRDGVDYMRLALEAQLFHVLMKYREFLAGIDASAYARAAERLAGGLGRGGDPSSILARFEALDREHEAALRGTAEVAK
jgi:glycosyltransferase involved in cell wall biosynthesis